jgi:Gelsolin repeat
LAEKICTEGTVVTLDQGAGDDSATDFWAYLGGDGEIAEEDDDDVHVDEFAPLLFKLPGDPEDEAEQIAKGEKVSIGFTTSVKLSRDLLDESDVFLLDSGWEVFLWIGSKSDKSEKLGALGRADTYLNDDVRTSNLPLSIVKSGYEPSEFNAYFV